VQAGVTERRGSGRGRSREGVHVQCTQRGQCIAGALVRSRVENRDVLCPPSGPTTLGDEVFLCFFKLLLLFIYLFCDVVEVVIIQKAV
jgi:hypothetical protein